jgi:hypothetical protein
VAEDVLDHLVETALKGAKGRLIEPRVLLDSVRERPRGGWRPFLVLNVRYGIEALRLASLEALGRHRHFELFEEVHPFQALVEQRASRHPDLATGERSWAEEVLQRGREDRDACGTAERDGRMSSRALRVSPGSFALSEGSRRARTAPILSKVTL